MSNIHKMKNGDIVISGCVISFPTLFVPEQVGRPGHKVGDPCYSATFILPVLDEADTAVLNEHYASAIQKVWPANDPPPFAPDKVCFKEALPSFPGRMVLSAKARQDQPPQVYIHGARMTKDQADQIFAGCIVSLATRLFCSPNWKNGISASLNMVQVDDNLNVERMDNRLTATEAFGIPDEGFPAATSPPPNQPGPAVPAQQQVAPGAPAPAAGPLPGVPTLPDFLS